MSRFAIQTPYFVIVVCLIISIIGAGSVARMPVDMFPTMNIPVVVVATFYSGMPPEQIEADITGRFERFFTLASNIDHIESRSLTGVSVIKIYFQPGTNADAAAILKTDSDGDGIPDLVELQQGTDPFDGLPTRTGIVASVATPGTAVDLCAADDLVILAELERGISVFNIFDPLNPTLVAQVDTPGRARAVASSGDLVAVADDEAGLAVIRAREA